MTMTRLAGTSGHGFLLPVLISLGFHGILLVLPAAPQAPIQEGEPSDRIEISLSEMPETGEPAEEVVGFLEGAASVTADVSLPPPASQAITIPIASRGPDRRLDAHDAAVEKKPVAVRQAPSPADVLSDAQALTATRASATPSAAARPADRTRRVEQELGWEGKGRALLKQVDPQFPDRLAVAGVEADCEARIAVSPGGNVVRVEITRGSGYIEIDNNVEAALRQFLFSRSDSGSEAAGTVRFRFRLGKRE